MSIVDDWSKILDEDLSFNETKWEDLLNCDAVCTEHYSASIETIDLANAVNHRDDIVKLSMSSLKQSTFMNSGKLVRTGQLMTIHVPPALRQRVRYQNECEKILRFISVPERKSLTIGIPDLRYVLGVGDALWMRITRTTSDHRKDNLIFHHPYPMWIKEKNAKIHNGSIFIQISQDSIKNGFIKIDTLAMIRLKQDDLARINTLAIYSSTHLDLLNLYSIKIKTPKRIRDEHKLRQSVLNFQLVRVDQNNVAYLTDCLCHTDVINEIEAGRQQQQSLRFPMEKNNPSQFNERMIVE